MGNNDLSTGFHLNIPRETYNPLSQDLSYTKFKVSFITSVSNKPIKTKMVCGINIVLLLTHL